MKNYIIDDNSELSEVTDSLYKFLKVNDSIYHHSISIVCLPDTETCSMNVDEEVVEHSGAVEAVDVFGKELEIYFHCSIETAHELVRTAIIRWKDCKEAINIGLLKH